MVETFPIIPAEARAMWPLALLVAFVLVIAAGAMLGTARGSRTSRFELSDEGLRLRGDLYGRMIPASRIRGSTVRIVDVLTAPEYAPRMRTMGTSVGGYQAGWFRLRNGEKALLYLTDRRRAVYAQTSAGYSLLLSPQEPERFAARLKEIAR